MKYKKVVISIVSLLIVISIILFISFTISKRNGYVTIGKRNQYGTIEVNEGVSTSQDYKYVILDQNIVELSDISSKNGPQKDELGGSIDRVYKFKVLKEGKTKIVFTTEYFGDKNSIYEYVEYNVNIDKNLNMTITEGPKKYNMDLMERSNGDIKFKTLDNKENSWNYEIENETIIKYLNAEQSNEKITTYFIGLQEGKTRIKINYKNENSENVSEVYEAAVDKDLNVTILKIE